MDRGDLESDDAALVEHATAVAAAIHTVRDLVSTPASDLYPETLAAAGAIYQREPAAVAEGVGA